LKKNLIFSVLGALFNTLLPIIIFPYISRVLGVETLGVYYYYNSIITYLGLFTFFGTNIFGIKELGKYKDDINKRNQVTLELIIISVIFTLICYLFIALWILFVGSKSDIDIILLLSIGLIMNSVGPEWFFIAIEKQKYLLYRNIIIKTLTLIAIILFVKESSDLLVFIFITVAATSLSSFLNIYFINKKIDFSLIDKKFEIRKYIYPLFVIFLIEIEVRFFGLGDVIILGNIEGEKAVGFYSMGLKVYLIVSSLLKITAIALLPRAAYYIKIGAIKEFNNFIKQTINLIFLIGLPASIITYIWNTQIILLIGGQEFLPAANLLRNFSFLIIISVLINTIVFQILYPLNKIRSITIVYSLSIILNIVLNYILIPKYSYIGAFYAFLFTHVLMLLYLLVKEKKVLLLSMFSINILKYFYASSTSVLMIFIIKYFISNMNFIFEILIFSLCYGILLLAFRDVLIINIAKILKNKIEYEKS
jgi:O-antigen/teichoic acid export membrane protein